MPLLAVLANPRAEARAAMRTSTASLSDSILRLVRMSPRARAEISTALRTVPLKAHVSGTRGEFIRFRLKEPKGYQSFALIVLAPKHLRGMTPTEARARLGQTGFRRLTLGVIGRKGPGRSELQSVLVPKVRVSMVTQKYLRRTAVANPTPKGTAHPLKRIVGPIRWEDMTKAQKLQLQAQFLYGGMPYNPSGTYWSLMQYPKQVGGMRLWKQSQFVKSNGSCCRNAPRCRHNSIMPFIAGGMAAGVAGAVANRLLRNPSPIAVGTAPDGTVYKVVRKSSTGEWVVRAYVGGKVHEGRTYYTTDKADALGTLRSLVGRVIGHVEIGGPDIIKLGFNKKRRRVRRNPGTAPNVINVPFHQGRKYSVAQVQKWVEANGTPAMKKRFSMAMAQYKKFHKGAMPRFITYSQYKMGSHPGISDVEFGVSEGHEWMAAYQVPRSSGKWMDKESSGRYVHAHGDSDIDVDVKRPVKLSKLPVRFHTPDGKAVGVIPSRNVKIGEWYEG